MMWMKKNIKELDIYISDGNYSSKYPRSEEFVEEGIPFIRGNNMVDGDITDDEMYYITPEKHSILLKGHVKAGDVLITTRGNIGQVAIVPDRHEDSNINAQIVLLRTNQETLYNRYLLWALQSHEANEQYLALQTGTALKQLPVGKLEKLSIEVTDINKQHKIADILDKTYEVVKLRRKELQLLDDLIKARFVEMFGDRYVNDKNWNTTKLGDSISFNNGKAHEQVVDEKGAYILVTSRAIASDFKDVRRTNELLFPLHKNDIVMVMSDVPNGKALAKCQLIEEDNKYTLNQRICSFDNYNYNPVFLLFLLSRHPYFLSFNDGNGQTNLRKNDILNCELIVPPMELQKEFASFVGQVDKSKFKEKSCYIKYKILKIRHRQIYLLRK